MKHLGTQQLETSRLILRRFTMEDAQAMYDNWASDDEVTRYIPTPTQKDVSDSQKVLAEWTANYEKDDYYQWAIVVKDSGPDPIGSIAVYGHDDRMGKVHIGYLIGRKWWNQGVTTEAFKCIIDFLFDQVGVQRIEALYDPRNANSGEVMKKCGLKYEGTLRKANWNNQGVCDASYYALLADER